MLVNVAAYVIPNLCVCVWCVVQSKRETEVI